MFTPLRTVRQWHWPLALLALAMSVLTLISAVGLVVDDRVITGSPAWAKPLKFSMSFAIYSLTLAWMIPLIPRPRWRRIAWWGGAVAAAASLLEVGAIALQVVRGTSSHYNGTTPFNEQVFNAMGAFAATLYLGTLVIGAALLRSPMRDAAFAWALRLGMLIAVGGMSVGFLMLMPTPAQTAQGEAAQYRGAHAVGVADGGPGLNFLGWSTTGGDLRVGHFIGMHGLQVLPLLAMLLALPALRRHLSERTRLQVVVLAAVVYAGLVVLTIWQALRSQPLLAPDQLTMTAAGVLVAVAVLGSAAIAIGRRRSLPAKTQTTGSGGDATSQVYDMTPSSH
jgi:hypothetical protein